MRHSADRELSQQTSSALEGDRNILAHVQHSPRLQLNGLLQLHLLFRRSLRRVETAIYSSAATADWICITNQSVGQRLIAKSLIASQTFYHLSALCFGSKKTTLVVPSQRSQQQQEVVFDWAQKNLG